MMNTRDLFHTITLLLFIHVTEPTGMILIVIKYPCSFSYVNHMSN